MTSRRRPPISSPAMPLLALPVLLLAGSLSAVAAPPPGHPSPADAYRMMQSEAAPPASSQAAVSHVAAVIQALEANEYTYAEVREDGRTQWVAAPRTTVSGGDTIRFDDGAVMTDFYSKRLQRSFPAVMFVSEIAVVPSGN